MTRPDSADRRPLRSASAAGEFSSPWLIRARAGTAEDDPGLERRQPTGGNPVSGSRSPTLSPSSSVTTCPVPLYVVSRSM